MCQSKANGGQRCYGHTSKQLSAALVALDSAERDGVGVDEAREALLEAQIAHATTQQGQTELLREVDSLDLASPERAQLLAAIATGTEERQQNDYVRSVMTTGNAEGNIAMTEIATEAAGVSERDAQLAFITLREEGAALNLDDPTGEQVEAFLATQESNVRHNDQLQAAKKVRLLRRLANAAKAAREKVLPDAATFHAWKNVVAEAWSSVRRKATVAVASGLAVMAIGACSSSHTAAEPTPLHSPSTSISSSVPAPTPAPSTSVPASHTGQGVPSSAFAHRPAFTGPAVKKWGQADVQSAYREAVNFTFEQGWDPAAMNTPEAQVDLHTYQNALSYMSPKVKSDVTKLIEKAQTGDQKALTVLESWRYTGLTGPNGSLTQADPAGITNRSFSNGKVSVDTSTGKERLAVSFTSTANINTKDAAGKTYSIPSHRKMTFWMVKNTGAGAQSKPWLIDGLMSYQWTDKAS